MDKKNQKNIKNQLPANATAPRIDPEDAYGETATNSETKKGESTVITRFIYDEYNPSDH